LEKIEKGDKSWKKLKKLKKKVEKKLKNIFLKVLKSWIFLNFFLKLKKRWKNVDFITWGILDNGPLYCITLWPNFYIS
jgi:hypothetical protein